MSILQNRDEMKISSTFNPFGLPAIVSKIEVLEILEYVKSSQNITTKKQLQ